MPFVKEASITLSKDDYGEGQYSDCYAKATLTATTDGDKVKYTITMKTSVGGKTNDKPGVALYLEIDDQVILNKYWVYNTNSDGWNNFPTVNGSKYSGTITTKATNDTSIPVTLKIATSFNPANNDKVWKKIDGTLTRTWYTDVGKGKVEITDNGDNTFKVTGSAGKAGTNNAVKSWELRYGYNTEYNGTTKSGTNHTLAGTAAQLVVYAKCTTEPTYGNSTVVETSKTIYRYLAPGDVGKPILAASSFKNGRLTTKQNWTYTWEAAVAGNVNSPVRGYRIRIYKNGNLIRGLKAGTGSTVTVDTGTNECLDREGGTNCSITFNPASSGFDFKPGDEVYISVFAWTRNGAGTVLWSGGGLTPVISDASIVQNSGVIRVCTSTLGTNKFVEGIVHICKENGKWTEADIVKVCTSTTGTDKWSEAE